MPGFSMLIVDDDARILESLARLMKTRDVELGTASDGDRGRELIQDGSFDLIMLDINLPGMDGLKLLREARRKDPSAQVVMMTAYALIDSAVEALRSGATDYLIKPFEPDQVFLIVDRIAERRRLLEANAEFSRQARSGFDFNSIVTRNAAFKATLQAVRKVAATELPMLVLGESGVGKELVARACHNESSRSDKPLISVNCAAIPAGLMEAEFFGHVKGAYTGAVSDAKGFFERADGSTLFLDEIGELPPELQVKLLRVLQEGQINRVGDSRPLNLDFRLLAATSRDLEEEIEKGRFRRDLYYRINVYSTVLPPLRDRIDDVPLLARHFLSRSSLPGKTLSEEAEAKLMEYSWPGNVRELENIVTRSCILAEGAEIRARDIPLGDFDEKTGYKVRIPPGLHDYKEVMRNVKDLAGVELISRALAHHDNHVTRTARTLGISRRLLSARLGELGLRDLDDTEEDENR